MQGRILPKTCPIRPQLRVKGVGARRYSWQMWEIWVGLQDIELYQGMVQAYAGKVPRLPTFQFSSVQFHPPGQSFASPHNWVQ